MGWSSGTRVFDTVVGLLLSDKPIEEKIEELILELEGMDWDSACESGWYDHPLVNGVIRKLHPSWFEGEDELLSCPACGNEVEWANSRDRDILTSRIQCTCCELSCFHVDALAFLTFENLDYETTKLKYNAWCLTSPKYYGDYSWE